ncbi:MAG: hypothetical protein DRP50_08825 [Thermotoga sp.]|nr:MAG: hypothetical protein DRP50_08825 [Thermotoga sp.]
MAAMDNLPLAVAGDFNSWSDTLMEIKGDTYVATVTEDLSAGDYGMKIKKPGTWDSYRYPDGNYVFTLSKEATDGITISFNPKNWEFKIDYIE